MMPPIYMRRLHLMESSPPLGAIYTLWSLLHLSELFPSHRVVTNLSSYLQLFSRLCLIKPPLPRKVVFAFSSSHHLSEPPSPPRGSSTSRSCLYLIKSSPP
ncbi:hypothetical protein TIFTF001_026118 [Ficus carica]|uniref:Uncharacterized protein n=1 Tax=Ficus carica TaxID=3494 RepID=A0AA88ARR8_FICCA|nr:hypothetical protein TIFTF001_026118 [Ficus carica]